MLHVRDGLIRVLIGSLPRRILRYPAQPTLASRLASLRAALPPERSRPVPVTHNPVTKGCPGCPAVSGLPSLATGRAQSRQDHAALTFVHTTTLIQPGLRNENELDDIGRGKYLGAAGHGSVCMFQTNYA